MLKNNFPQARQPIQHQPNNNKHNIAFTTPGTNDYIAFATEYEQPNRKSKDPLSALDRKVAIEVWHSVFVMFCSVVVLLPYCSSSCFVVGGGVDGCGIVGGVVSTVDTDTSLT